MLKEINSSLLHITSDLQKATNKWLRKDFLSARQSLLMAFQTIFVHLQDKDSSYAVLKMWKWDLNYILTKQNQTSNHPEHQKKKTTQNQHATAGPEKTKWNVIHSFGSHVAFVSKWSHRTLCMNLKARWPNGKSFDFQHQLRTLQFFLDYAALIITIVAVIVPSSELSWVDKRN